MSVAPDGPQAHVIELIDSERRWATRGADHRQDERAGDAPVIRALYRAWQAGVRVDLIVRGICCLRPGVPGHSDNIRVICIVDRFLEHARIFYSTTGASGGVSVVGGPMPRNFDRRVEVMFPVEDEGLRAGSSTEILVDCP